MRTIILLPFILSVVSFTGAADDACVIKDFAKVADTVNKCTNIVIDSLKVPGGQTLLLILQDNSTVTFRGETVFDHAVWAGPLVQINATNAVIQGETGSTLNGQGQLYWDGKGEWGSAFKPMFFVLQLHNSVMKKINVLNAPIHGALLSDSSDVLLSNWVIDNSAGDEIVSGTKSTKKGHNTDGLDVWNSVRVNVTDWNVHNQDDCIAIRCGDQISVSNMVCIGGHGLSLSVGFSPDVIPQNTLTNVVIADSVLKGGRNGIHIKNHVDGGLGSITNVTYKNIVFSGMENYGINIQQNYKNSNSSLPPGATNNIPFKNFIFQNITGSVEAKAVPIYVNCAKDGCFNWNFTEVNIKGTKPNSCNFEPSNFKCQNSAKK